MTGKHLRIVFMGTPDFAVASLKRLVEGGYNVVGVVTAPDKPSGRGLQVHESAVKRYALDAGLHILQPEKLKSNVFIEQFRALDADLGIVIAFRMLPEVIWSAPRLGTFNLHASLLPQYRGAAPINWAIINGETQTGVTTFMLNDEIDKGDILMRSTVDITPVDNAGTLHDKLMEVGARLVPACVDMIAEGYVVPESQSGTPEEGLHPAPKIFKEDCRVDWRRSAVEIYNFIRGLSPYPASWSELVNVNGEIIPVKIFSAHVEIELHDRGCGSIVVNSEGTALKVACPDGYIIIEELQLAGKRRMSSVEFLRGMRTIAGCRLT